MLYSAKYNFIFSKSEKTASTSVEAALEYLIRGDFTNKANGFTNSILYLDGSRIGYRGSNPKDDPNFNTPAFSANHQSLKQTKQMIGDKMFHNAFKISCIRNPYERLISSFHYFGGYPLDKFTHYKLNGEGDSIKSAFTEYIKSHKSAFYDGRAHFYCDNQMIIDKFVRAEHLHKDLSDVLNYLDASSDDSKNILANIPAFKVSKRSQSNLVVSDYYTTETLELVNNRLSDWFALGGYTRIDSISDLENQYKKI